jgi:two-component system, sensor histidine kinase YesM
MVKRRFWPLRGLMARFYVTFLIVIILPVTLFSYMIYTNSMEKAKTELLNAKRSALLTDRLYLQKQFQNIEQKYNQFKNSRSLRDVLDGTYATNKTVMYEYIREIQNLVMLNKNDEPFINDILIYTSNSVAEDILPPFYPLSELYAMTTPKAFAQNPRRELFRRFWKVEVVDDGLHLLYFAGLMDTLYQKISGVLVIDCNASLLDLLISQDKDTVSSYLYFDGELLYTKNTTPQSDALLQRTAEAMMEQNNETVVLLDEQSGMGQSLMRLGNQNIVIIQNYPFPISFQISPVFWMAILLFFGLSIMILELVFKPMHNIAQLAKHMKNARSAELIPFKEVVGQDEVSLLVQEYNAMVVRTNALSKSMHENELLLRNAQIMMLQSQINPHFFYGTLENIRMIAEMHGETLIAEIAYGFSKLMRYSLSQEYLVSLKKEMGIVKQYVKIQKKRLGNRFGIKWKQDLDSFDWKIPKFALFSMVENAFTHDVSNSRKTVHIEILVQQNGDELMISVVNDGPGIQPERLALLKRLIAHPNERVQIASNHNGRSIFNISDRLRLYYGDDYTMTIESVPDQRTECRVVIRRLIRGDMQGDFHA